MDAWHGAVPAFTILNSVVERLGLCDCWNWSACKQNCLEDAARGEAGELSREEGRRRRGRISEIRLSTGRGR